MIVIRVVIGIIEDFVQVSIRRLKTFASEEIFTL